VLQYTGNKYADINIMMPETSAAKVAQRFTDKVIATQPGCHENICRYY